MKGHGVDIIKLLDVGIGWIGQRVAEVRPEHWQRDTPCREWTVRQLLNHMMGTMDTMTRVVAGQAWEQEVDAQALAETDRIGQDPAGAFEAIARRALAVWHAPGVLQRTCAMPMGPMPGAAVAGFCLTDGVVHGWDVARAIGRNMDIPAELAEPMMEIVRPIIHKGLRGKAFADEVRIGAGSPSDRLVAFLGRTP